MRDFAQWKIVSDSIALTYFFRFATVPVPTVSKVRFSPLMLIDILLTKNNNETTVNRKYIKSFATWLLLFT